MISWLSEGEPMKVLEDARKRIDKIDDKLLHLLEERAKVSLTVSKIKKKTGAPAFQAGREREIFSKLEQRKGIFPKDSLKEIWHEIISASLKLQKSLRIAYLGPIATFTELAVKKRFGSLPRAPLASIADVFAEVQRGNYDLGVVPIENSSEGSVSSTLDMFFDSPLKICGEIVVDVEQCLLAKKGDRANKIIRIYSHPQALGQCRGWIRKNFPCAELIETSSTAKAAEIVRKKKGAAAIASPLAAEEYGLAIVARGISDQIVNKTRFLVIGNIEPKPSDRDKTSLLFTTKHVPGALHNALKVLHDRRINMTKIESRPVKGKVWEYAFFVDIQGHKDDRNTASALEELRKHTLLLKVIGSYPEEF